MGLLYTWAAPSAGGTTLCVSLGLSVGRFGIDLSHVAFELDRLVAWTKVTVQEEVAQQTQLVQWVGGTGSEPCFLWFSVSC